MPNARQIRDWKKKPPGIRSQLVNIKSGRLEQDFIVENFHNSTHILNAVSPGWTSAIPFGRWVATEKVLSNFGRFSSIYNQNTKTNVQLGDFKVPAKSMNTMVGYEFIHNP